MVQDNLSLVRLIVSCYRALITNGIRSYLYKNSANGGIYLIIRLKYGVIAWHIFLYNCISIK